jgi:hypothetical protein
LYGIIKEVAPVSGADNDKKLGVGEFESLYFPHKLYRDSSLSFYKYLGNRNILLDNEFSWNPLQWYSSYNQMKERLKTHGLKGNMAGEGLRLGGILVISPARGIVYTYLEKTGSPIPENEIMEAVKLAF